MSKKHYVMCAAVIVCTIILTVPSAHAQGAEEVRGVDVGMKFGTIVGAVIGGVWLLTRLFKRKK